MQSERAVGLLYGQRALMIGALHPIAFIGTTQRSAAQRAPWKRLTHTAEMFEAVFFGSREEADRALAYTARLHARVRGSIPEPAGPYPAGTPFDAYDPALMLWVVAPMYDSAVALYELFVRPLSADEREELWRDYLRFGELFGMPRASAPADVAALDAWWAAQRDSDAVFLTDHARAVGLSIGTRLPVPLYARLPIRLGSRLLVGSLPGWVRERYGLRWTGADEAALRAAGRAIRASRPLVPRAVRRGPSLPFYRVVAREERANLRAGRESFPAPV